MDEKLRRSKEKQRQEVLDSFSIVAPDILLCIRIKAPSPYQIEQNISTAQTLAQQHNCHYYINDARGSERPTVDIREVIRERCTRLNGYIQHLIVVLDKDLQFKITLKFIFQTLDIDYPVSIVYTLQEAYDLIESDRKTRASASP